MIDFSAVFDSLARESAEVIVIGGAELELNLQETE